MYADSVTPSMKVAITETQRRREIQNKYNVEHGIVPKTIVKRSAIYLKFLLTMTVNLKIQKAFKGTKTTVDRKTDKGNESCRKVA